MPEIGSNLVKDYDVNGNVFSVYVQYLGNVPSGRLAQEKDTWLSALIVDGNVLEMGHWYDLQDRHPSNEEVCDGVSRFWVDSRQVVEANASYRKAYEIVEKCASFMHDYFVRTATQDTDYDIVRMFVKENEWSVVLRPLYVHGRLVEFHKAPDADHVEITSYTEENELHIRLF